MARKSRGTEVEMPDDFEAEQDVRSLIEAEKIKKDPKRLKRARTKGREQRDALANVISTKKET